MRVRKGALGIGVSTIAAFVSACAAVPVHPERDGISVEAIVDAVQCELANVYTRKPDFSFAVENWLARTRLELKVVADAEFAPTATITPTLSATTETLTVPIGPDLRDQSIRNAVLEFDVHMRDLKPPHDPRNPNKLPECNKPSGLPHAEGSLGLADWLYTVARSSGRPDFAALNEATYDLEFIVLRGAHGGFTFKNAAVTADVSGGYIKRTNDNHMIVAFTYDPPPKQGIRRGKTRASAPASQRLDMQIQRFLPQRLNIPTPGTGTIIIR